MNRRPTTKSANRDERWAVITGCLGGIGQALVDEFTAAGYRILGTDFRKGPHRQSPRIDKYLDCDLDQFVKIAKYRSEQLRVIKQTIGPRLYVLVNNAALQVIKRIEDLTTNDWERTQRVNVTAPFFLAQGLIQELQAAAGGIINVGSIHAKLTKPKFVAYATSKAAIVGLTQAMAVELGSRVRVNAVCPAAVATPMLLEGFSENTEKLRELAVAHPVQRIGKPEEVARAVRLLGDGTLGFVTGATLNVDGGIGARLHDPI